MKRAFLIFVLMSAVALLLSACGSQPQIAVAEQTIDLGDVVNGEIMTRQVQVENQGEADLVVEAITTSCGCTQATLSPMTIPAGSSGLLTIQFDSGAHGPDLTGPILREVFIITNDPDQSEAVVALAANILPPPAP